MRCASAFATWCMPQSTTDSQRVVAYIGLGANLGDAQATLHDAQQLLAALPDTALQACSALYRTAPVDATGPDYLNAVVRLDTGLAPHALLGALQRIEQTHGRQRSVRNAPRTLDLDLLLYSDQCINTPDLVVPHPRLHQRAFVLRPLADIAPDLEVPGCGRVADLLVPLADQRIERL